MGLIIKALFWPAGRYAFITIRNGVLIKRLGLSLMMAVVRPAVMAATKLTAAPLPPNPTSQNLATSALDRFTSRAELPLLDVEFCGECVPFEHGPVADRWKHVFTLFRRQHASYDALQKRADTFFPIIDPILEKHGIPADFRYVPLAESGLKAKAVSPKGAAGYWQLMPQTARELGLVVNGRVDERFNARKATEAACRYLKKLYAQFGSWSLVAAAYNVGPGYIKAQLRRQPNADYYRMRLPRETTFYLYRVLVYKEMLSRPADYSPFLTPQPQTAYWPLRSETAVWRQAA